MFGRGQADLGNIFAWPEGGAERADLGSIVRNGQTRRAKWRGSKPMRPAGTPPIMEVLTMRMEPASEASGH